MIDAALLGTGGTMPLPYRNLTALLVRCNGSSVLIDCGEATQISVRKLGWSFHPIDTILLTHFHADHVSGLPGLLLTLGNAERTEPITIVGPKGVEKVVNSLRVIAPGLPFEIKFRELEEQEETFKAGELKVNAFRVNHNVPCYGYSLSLDRSGRFMTDAAKALDIPLKYWSRLQKGEIIDDPETGRHFTPDMVMGADRKGLKITYTTDTRPTPLIEKNAAGSDLFICEGMYGDKAEYQKALEKKHMMMQEAAKIAKNGEVTELWLTHFSPSMAKPQEYAEEIRGIFPNSVVAKDRMVKELNFEEE